MGGQKVWQAGRQSCGQEGSTCKVVGGPVFGLRPLTVLEVHPDEQRVVHHLRGQGLGVVSGTRSIGVQELSEFWGGLRLEGWRWNWDDLFSRF